MKNIKIKVLGTGCPGCKKLYNDVNGIIKELKINAEVDYIDDLKTIMSYGIMSLPALVIDEQVKFMGRTLSKEELKKYLIKDIK